MGLELEQFKEELKTFIKNLCPDTIQQATVIAINDDDDTIAVTLSDDKNIPDVRLKSVVKQGNKKITKPSLNSSVLVGRIEGSDEYVVIANESIDEEKIIIGTTQFIVNENGFTIIKGNDDLKDALTLIVQAVQQIVVIYGNNPDYTKLQTALTKIDNILQ